MSTLGIRLSWKKDSDGYREIEEMSEKTTSRERLLELAHLIILNPDDESVLTNLYSELGRLNLKKECCSPTDLIPWIVNTLDYHWILDLIVIDKI